MDNETQEIFNRVWHHFITQKNPRAVVPHDGRGDEICVYRGDRDPKSSVRCAVGLFLPDDTYHPRMEGSNVDGLNMRGLLPEIVQRHLTLFIQLQDAHDFGADADLARRLRDVAIRFGLTIPGKGGR